MDKIALALLQKITVSDMQLSVPTTDKRNASSSQCVIGNSDDTNLPSDARGTLALTIQQKSDATLAATEVLPISSPPVQFTNVSSSVPSSPLSKRKLGDQSVEERALKISKADSLVEEKHQEFTQFAVGSKGMNQSHKNVRISTWRNRARKANSYESLNNQSSVVKAEEAGHTMPPKSP